MVIWKDGMPYIVREIDDLKDLIDGELFESIKEFLEELADNSDEIYDLKAEIEDLNNEIWGNQDEIEELESIIETLREKYSSCLEMMTVLRDFLDVVDGEQFNKDQVYYYDKLLDIIAEI